MRKCSRKSKRNSEIKEIMNILDKNYFHVCIVTENDNIKWKIFFKNMKEDDYFSIHNKPILSSDRNTINDIYLLNKKFEDEKKNTFSRNIKEFIKKEFKFFKLKNKLIKKINNILTIFMYIPMIVTGLNVCVFNSLFLGIISLIIATYAGILSIMLNESLSKCFFRELKDMEERYIQEKIYYEWLNFVNRIIPERGKNEKIQNTNYTNHYQ